MFSVASRIVATLFVKLFQGQGEIKVSQSKRLRKKAFACDICFKLLYFYSLHLSMTYIWKELALNKTNILLQSKDPPLLDSFKAVKALKSSRFRQQIYLIAHGEVLTIKTCRDAHVTHLSMTQKYAKQKSFDPKIWMSIFCFLFTAQFSCLAKKTS